jgi:Protein of unknown function DUF72
MLARPMAENHKPVTARPIGNIYCGTCSWTDRTLIESGGFYATDMRSPAARLRYYAQVFPIVEVDATYYALPSEQNARLWVERNTTRLCLQYQGVWPFDPASISRAKPTQYNILSLSRNTMY